MSNHARGFFGIGISHGKTAANLGTLWRSAHLLGADFIFTIGARYSPQSSDTSKAWKSTPLWAFDAFEDFKRHMPREALIVGVELHPIATPVAAFEHPERAVYLLGAEDHGLTAEEIAGCHRLVQLPGDFSMNVASAGTIVMYDRLAKNVRAA